MLSSPLTRQVVAVDHPHEKLANRASREEGGCVAAAVAAAVGGPAALCGPVGGWALRFWPAAVVAVAAAVTGAVLTGVATMAPPRSRHLVVAARGSALARSRVVSIGSGCRACRSIGL